jgi:soluble lytic murein transglycosylase-like protein
VRVRRNVIAAVGVLSLGAGTAVAAAAQPDNSQVVDGSAQAKLLERPGERLIESIETHRELDRLRDAHERLVTQALAVGAEVEPGATADLTVGELEDEIEALRNELEQAADADSIAGVPRATLEAIASCESGGDPTAVSSDGTYRGKYQFDRGTWASIGGSGDPAAAPEIEQDYRAALLYQRAGSSPWPICG